MDEKMRKAFREWLDKDRLVALNDDIVEWTLDYLRSQQEPVGCVGYLDIGIGGYIDIGSDLSDEELLKLPPGRYALKPDGIFGVDGYRPIPSAHAVPQWQPIETAPTDGTRILLCGRDGKIADWHYGQPDGFANPKRFVWPYIHANPTHWAPLALIAAAAELLPRRQ